ncbi:uncharacterized protein LOC131669155 [Phymastichus coffea]|uniref:uncharacterized protein LOC131669155 n=1 Tax=Phymastichus coffea TaxID=108790 RepID=UPI00273AEFDD|nr:uncharacterized protein LOC131669155 [Phymastichus coffea]
MLVELRLYLKMCRRAYFISATILAVFVNSVTSSSNTIDNSTKKPALRISDLFDKSKMKHHYPVAWTEFDYKPIIDNDRLFKKYKDCIIAEHFYGCPRIVTEFKKLIPEIIESLCAKCLPIHIERFKEAACYIYHKRRADFDEVRRLRDPDGTIQARFEAKYGELGC